jgi:hypothetical protein
MTQCDLIQLKRLTYLLSGDIVYTTIVVGYEYRHSVVALGSSGYNSVL